MLTRIEIDGFKSFSNFALNLHPFTVVVGPNGVGKSNLFDAIQLVSRCASCGSLNEAFIELRGQPHELFRRESSGKLADEMTFAVEVLLDATLKDAYGIEVNLSNTRLRYELVVTRAKNANGVEKLIVKEERARPLFAREDRFWRDSKRKARAFCKSFIKRGGKRTPYLDMGEKDGLPVFEISQDAGGWRKRYVPNAGVEATVLSSITSSTEFPTLYALREELSSWRFFQPDPAALRKSSSTLAKKQLDVSGTNLPTVLARIRSETGNDIQNEGALVDIAADLVHLIPGVRDINVLEDEKNREYYIQIQMREGPPFDARVVSDGTLRVLALLTILHDPRRKGLVFVEEPENGVHPQRLRGMIESFRSLVTSVSEKNYEEDEPLDQLLVNSHSPVVLSCLDEKELVFVDTITVTDPVKKTAEQKTHARKVKLQGELLPDERRDYVSAHHVEEFLDPKKWRSF